MAPARAPSFWDDPRGITPVVGTLLVLAITVIGMTTIMFWGAPTIERLRVGNTQTAIIGEFEDVRQQVQQLSVPDAARLPEINVPGGVFGIENGTRFLLGAEMEAGPPGCDLLVEDWSAASATPKDQATVTLGTCGAVADNGNDGDGSCGGGTNCLRVYEVRGGSLVEQIVDYDGASAITVTASGGASVDLTSRDRDWLFRISDDDANPPTTVYAEAWLLSSDRLYWRQQSSGGIFEAYFDSGAIFSGRSGAFFQEERPIIQEQIYGTPVFRFWLYTLDASSYGEITATGTYQAFIGLQSLHARVDDPVRSVRLSFHGHLSEAWCESFLVRNSFIDGTPYAGDTGLNADAALACTEGNAEGIRGVTYSEGGSTFPFHLIHANLRTTVQL